MYRTAIVTAMACAATLVHADFLIYMGGSNQILDGGGAGIQFNYIFAFSAQPSCEDIGKYRGLQSPENDATSAGRYACDGGNEMTETLEQLPITRLELAHKKPFPIFEQITGSITLYKDRNYDIIGGDGATLGTCTKIEQRVDDYVCSGGALASSSGLQYFDCKSSLVPRQIPAAKRSVAVEYQA